VPTGLPLQFEHFAEVCMLLNARIVRPTKLPQSLRWMHRLRGPRLAVKRFICKSVTIADMVRRARGGTCGSSA
jgi:hypothetical protein